MGAPTGAYEKTADLIPLITPDTQRAPPLDHASGNTHSASRGSSSQHSPAEGVAP